MARSRSYYACPVCSQAPKPDEFDRLTCECPGVFWRSQEGEAGSADDRALLEAHGWLLIERLEDAYWIGPFGNVLYLYGSTAWYCDTAPRRFGRLREYLEWYSSNAPEAGS